MLVQFDNKYGWDHNRDPVCAVDPSRLCLSFHKSYNMYYNSTSEVLKGVVAAHLIGYLSRTFT